MQLSTDNKRVCNMSCTCSFTPVSAPLPLVTVIIPCYNHENYVERAVLSVLNQTYAKVELVVIDDGSQDASVVKLQSLQRCHPFQLICQENRGVCRTLNRGIRDFSKGDYIALLASDDFWRTDKLQLQMAELSRHPESEFCFSQALEFVDESTAVGGLVFPGKCLSGNVVNQVFVRQHVPAGTMLFSRALFDRLGGFDETLKEEDWDFVIRSAAATPFSSVNAPLLYYRSHSENTMKTRSRAAIFHQKAKILAKNFDLVSPWRWLFAVFLHFAHDILLCRFRRN
jgi:alpha-1,3-rhamnosyltransferase